MQHLLWIPSHVSHHDGLTDTHGLQRHQGTRLGGGRLDHYIQHGQQLRYIFPCSGKDYYIFQGKSMYQLL
jgi:hypothetical protein